MLWHMRLRFKGWVYGSAHPRRVDERTLCSNEADSQIHHVRREQRDPLSIEKHTAENSLIAGLPPRCRADVLRSCEQVELQLEEVLCEPGQRIRHVYFPIEGFVSLVAVLDDGGALEVGIIGGEGMVGASVILGVDTLADRAVVQRAGAALRMRSVSFRGLCARNMALRMRVGLYLYASMAQLAQVAACTGYHVVEARLARWLLMSRDRAHKDEFHLTHEFLAYMLGVRRVGITEAATALQARGLITYNRGDITILDNAGLEKASCDCYERGNLIYEATMGFSFARSARRRAAQASGT